MSGEVLVLNSNMMPMKIIPEVSTMDWEVAIKAIYINSVVPIAYYDDWCVRSPTTEMLVPSIIMTKRYVPVEHSVGLSAENVKLRDRYTCQHCGLRFRPSELTMDHVTPATFGGKWSWDNLVASCSPCNNSRGSDFRIKPMIVPYKPTYYEMLAKRKEFVIEVPHQTWVDYLDWPKDKIVVKPRRSLKRTASMTLVQLTNAA